METKFPSIKNVPQTERVKIIEMVAKQTVTISGPIPLPSVLKGYNEIDPSLGQRIVAMAELEQKYDQELHGKIIDAEIKAQHNDHVYRIFGLVLALIALIGMLVLVGYLATIDQAKLAGLFGLGGIGAIVWMFINGRSGKGPEKPPVPQQQGKQSKKKR